MNSSTMKTLADHVEWCLEEAIDCLVGPESNNDHVDRMMAYSYYRAACVGAGKSNKWMSFEWFMAWVREENGEIVGPGERIADALDELAEQGFNAEKGWAA
jgi:hypothetical protein